MRKSNSLRENVMIPRPYQNEAIHEVFDFTKNLLRETLEARPNIRFSNSSLLEMATGSGKTFVAGKFVEKILKLRNRFNRMNGTHEFEGLNILVLSNRIEGVNQFRDDLVHGKEASNDNFPPILPQKALDNIISSTFHSKADNQNDEEDEVESFSEKSGKKDNLYFATQQTANLRELTKKLKHIDLIIVDEAHNVKEDGEFVELIESLNQNGRNGNPPHIIALTGTPTDVTKKLFGEPVFNFGLEKYIASPYSPDIEYHLITKSDAGPEEIDKITQLIEQAKKMPDIREKRRIIKEIESIFDDIMSKYGDYKELAQDILKRIEEEKEINETIIFANSIDEANKLSYEINEITGKNISLSYHSKNESNKALKRLGNKDDNIKIVVAVGKLNESIDLPEVANVVFLRNTEVERIFLQQFGRGLRGKGIVRYFDYVGGIKNFLWIGNIYERYKKEKENTKSSGTESIQREKFSLIGESILGKGFNINLGDIGLQISKMLFEIENICEIGEEKEIDGITYIGVTYDSDISGIKGRRLQDYAKRKNAKIIQGYQKSGNSIRLIPKNLIEEYSKIKFYKHGEIEIIDGVEHIVIGSSDKINMGIQDIVILNNAKKDGIKIIRKIQKNWRNIYLIPTTYIQELKKKKEIVCAIGEEVEIEGITYFGVTQDKGLGEKSNLNGQYILNKAKIRGIKTIRGVQKINGHSITLVPKDFINELEKEIPIHKCDVGEEIEIEGIRYIGVTGTQIVKGINGQIIINNVKRNGIKTLIGKQRKNNSKVQLIPIDYVNSLNETYEIGIIYNIGGKEYVAFTYGETKYQGISSYVLKKFLKENGLADLVISGKRQKNGTPINLIPKDIFDKIRNR